MDFRQFWMATDNLSPFALFKPPHIIALGVCALLVMGIALGRKWLRRPLVDRVCRAVLFIVLASQQLLYYLWKRYDQSPWPELLPFHICGFAIYLCLITLATGNRKVFGIVYFFALPGTLIAVFTPSMEGYNFPHFRFYQYFIGHLSIILVAFYFKIAKQYKITMASVGTALLTVNILAVVAYVANRLFGTNYMFLMGKPDSFSFLNFFAPWPFYILQLEIVTAFLFFVVYAITDVKALPRMISRLRKKPPMPA